MIIVCHCYQTYEYNDLALPLKSTTNKKLDNAIRLVLKECRKQKNQKLCDRFLERLVFGQHYEDDDRL